MNWNKIQPSSTSTIPLFIIIITGKAKFKKVGPQSLISLSIDPPANLLSFKETVEIFFFRFNKFMFFKKEKKDAKIC